MRVSGRNTQSDPRYLRVRESLREAILSLARDRPCEEISVSELTAAAGISRTTFYSHASSPSQLLADVLVDELRPELERLAEEMSHPGAHYVELWKDVYRVLLDQVRRHDRVYTTMLEANSPAFGVLLDYLETVSRRNVEAVVTQFDGQPGSTLWRAMAVKQLVHNTVAMIAAWVQTGMADSPEWVIATYLTLAPPWQLARPDADGKIVMRRKFHRAGPDNF